MVQACKQVLAAAETVWSLPSFPGIRVTRTQWEHPVTTKNEYTVGFIDLEASYERPYCSIRDECPSHSGQYWTDWRPEFSISWQHHAAYFEVKTAIPSLGELLRQLQLYQLHLKGKIFVVSPDARFADKIREQGYGFIQYPGATPTADGNGHENGWLFGPPRT